MKTKCTTKNIEVKLESIDPLGTPTSSDKFIMEAIDGTECMKQERLILHVGECLYRIDNKGYIIERLIPHE